MSCNQNLSTNEGVVVPNTAVITAVTAVLRPSQSPCHSLYSTQAKIHRFTQH